MKAITHLYVLVLAAASTVLHAGNVAYKLECELPSLPVEECRAGDIELSPDRSIEKIEIPGFRTIVMSVGDVSFMKEIQTEKPSTLDVPGALKLADSFLDNHFPQQSRSRKWVSVGRMMRGKGAKPEIAGYTVKYALCHKDIPIHHAGMKVVIRGNEVEEVDLCRHKVREVSKKEKLLEAQECLERLAETLGTEKGILTVTRAKFGYQGGFRQSWQDPTRRGQEEGTFLATPVYEFGFQVPSRSNMNVCIVDARTGDLLYPKPEALPETICLPGPSLTFPGRGEKKLFLLAPRDVRIEKASIEAEAVGLKCESRTYSVKELFQKHGEWGFVSHRNQWGLYLILNSNQDRTSEAKGVFRVDDSETYEVEMKVFQGYPGEKGRAVSVTIDGESKTLGTKGPNTAHAWETWGTVALDEGEHRISLKPAEGSVGYWEVGPLSLQPEGDFALSWVRDLQIAFGRSNGNTYSVAAPKGSFETANLESELSFALRRETPGSVKKRNMTTLRIASSSAGQLDLHALRLSLVAGNEEEVKQKSAQFLLVGPKGEVSRPVSAADMEALFAFLEYLEGGTASLSKGHTNVTEALQLCSVISKLVAGRSDRASRRAAATCASKTERLAREEAKWLALDFKYYAGDWPRPQGFPRGWADRLVTYRIPLDGDRLTSDGGYLDPWGNPYQIRDDDGKISVRSLGPNGREDGGQRDDILGTEECRW